MRAMLIFVLFLFFSLLVCLLFMSTVQETQKLQNLNFTINIVDVFISVTKVSSNFSYKMSGIL